MNNIVVFILESTKATKFVNVFFDLGEIGNEIGFKTCLLRHQ